MGRYVPWLSDGIENFVKGHWDTDLREVASSAQARRELHADGIDDAVRRFLLDVIHRDAVTPEEWGDLCNVQARTREDVRRDATHFWDWLFDEEPLPRGGGPRGPLQPPQA